MADDSDAPPPFGMSPGMGAIPAELPPRPGWETLVILFSGLSLAVFFFPDAMVPAVVKVIVGVVAVAGLVGVFVRRLNAVRGSHVMPDQQLQLGGPKPYHKPRRHPSRNR